VRPAWRVDGGAAVASWDSLLDLVFPRGCDACGARDPDEGGHLCWNCQAEVPFVRPPFCSLCGDPVSGRVDHEYVCALCSDRRVHFDEARSVARYEGPVALAIRALKYHAHLWIARDLAAWLEAAVRTHYDPVEFDGVTFVPLHPLTKRERGFNQAEVLAADLARRLRTPLVRRAVRRVRLTPTQTRLTVPQRAANVHDAFEPRGPRVLNGRRILLVDDVMTTGATVNECSRALKAGGAAVVRVVTVARG